MTETSETMSSDTSSFLWFPLSDQTLTYMESKKREEEMRRASRYEENLKPRIKFPTTFIAHKARGCPYSVHWTVPGGRYFSGAFVTLNMKNMEGNAVRSI